MVNASPLAFAADDGEAGFGDDLVAAGEFAGADFGAVCARVPDAIVAANTNPAITIDETTMRMKYRISITSA
jgi:hypothetical protein